MLTDEQAEELLVNRTGDHSSARTVTPSHFENARVIGPVTQEEYRLQSARRGDAKYVMSRSDLMTFAQCPRRWVAGYREETTKEMDYGTLLDCLILTPERFEASFSVAPAEYPAEVKKVAVMKPWNWNATFCDEWKKVEEANGRTVIKSVQLANAKDAVARMAQDEEIFEIIRGSKTQIMVTADYRDMSGIVVPMKILIDLVPNVDSRFGRCLADLKTATSASAHAWARQVFSYKLQVQAALYLDIWNAATGESRNEFRHIIQESFAPWEVGKRILSAEFIEDGRSRYKGALARYCACLRDKHWPGYDDQADDFASDVNLNGWTVTNPEAWMIGAQ